MKIKTQTRLIEGLKIETPEGFKKFAGIGKVLVKQPIMKFILEDKNFIEVNPNHLFNINGIEEYAKNLIEGDCLDTKNGLKKIIKIKFKNKKEYVYTLLEVESSDHSYYANNIRNVNCKFLGTASTLIDSDVLEMCQIKEPIATKWTGVFSIYEQPIKGKQYILGVDSAKGTGKDYSVIQVLKINNSHNIEQVAVYRNNLISPHDFAQVVISISQYYFDSYMMVENNEVGEAVCNTIWYEFENENLLSCDSKLEIIDGKHKKIYNGLGIRSTRKTNLEANLLLKDYAEKGWLKIYDSRTLYELARYEEIRPSIFSCGRDVHDDTITGLLWALYFLTTEFYDGNSTYLSSQIDEKYRLDNGQNDDEDDNQEPPAIVIDD